MSIMKNFLFYTSMLFICFISIFSIGYIYVYNYSNIEITDNNFFKENIETNIYDKDDNLIYVFSSYSLEKSTYDNISDDYYNAIISLEDNNFYNHKGVDILGMIKSIVRTLRSDGRYGGSTLTMQLAKLNYMEDWLIYDSEGYSKHDLYPIKYKLTQMSIAFQIEEIYSKEDIIMNYANTVFYGDGGYGIVSASKVFFQKDVTELTLRENVILAAIPNSPYGLSPYSNLDELNERVDYGLLRMYELGYISEKEYNEAIIEEKKFFPKTYSNLQKDDIKLYSLDYYDYVLSELKKLAPDINLYTASLDIYLNIDLNAQKAMNEAIKNTSYKQDGVQQGAINIDPNNGEIRAISSRTDSEDLLGGYNLATDLKRQPGSSIKPVLDYAPAIELLGYTKDSILSDIPTYYSNSNIEVNNYTNSHIGRVSLEQALRSSLNTTALKLFQEYFTTYGRDNVELYMESIGFTDTNDINEAYAIGGFNIGTSPLEMAGSYQMFANGGTYYSPHAIRKIKVKENSPYYMIPESDVDYHGFDIDVKKVTDENNGKIHYPLTLYFDNTSKEVISVNTANQITAILDASNKYSLAHNIWVDLDTTLAIKTGTTNIGQNARDTWAVGYTKDMVIAVWTGFENNEDFINEQEKDSTETFKDIIQ